MLTDSVLALGLCTKVYGDSKSILAALLDKQERQEISVLAEVLMQLSVNKDPFMSI